MSRPFLLAVQLLTRFPVKLGDAATADAESAGRSVLYYPLVGALIGGVLLLGQYLFAAVGIEAAELPHAALLLLVWVVITGALHLDGLGDSADAWLGGYGDRERTLSIMKDPYCGPAAVVSIVLVLLLKFSVLASLSMEDWALLLLSPILARAAVIALFMTTPYVRKGGMGEAAALHLPQQQAVITLLMVAALTLVLAGMRGVVILLAVALLFYILRRIMLQRIGGTTGDTTGALIELAEVCVLLFSYS